MGIFGGTSKIASDLATPCTGGPRLLGLLPKGFSGTTAVGPNTTLAGKGVLGATGRFLGLVLFDTQVVTLCNYTRSPEKMNSVLPSQGLMDERRGLPSDIKTGAFFFAGYPSQRHYPWYGLSHG